MKLYFAFVLLAIVLGLVYAAPTTPVNKNCFSLTSPTNGTTWKRSGVYPINWKTTSKCEGTYYVYMFPTTQGADGEYSMKTPFKATKAVDINSESATITLHLEEMSGTYLLAIYKEAGEDRDSTDVAIVDVTL
ncbi:hypothetical protein J3Q64DRAFT_1775391 [Phycomyces blakesleeanus]|uniref:Uncharacterized protein n=1 Tax=Phycomyces blakesleeanus TaxID=4837 RepID=A0ABR3AJ10_PHYBL